MPLHRNSIAGIVRISIVLTWVFLFAVLLRRDYFIQSVDPREVAILQQAESEEYQAIYFREDKIGYVLNRYNKEGDRNWKLQQRAFMRLNVAGSTQDVHLDLTATLSENNLLHSFSFSFQSPFYRMNANGQVSDTEVQYTLETGTNEIHDSLFFNTPPLLATSRRGYLLNQGIQKGEKRKVPWFDPFSLTGKESVLVYRGRESIQIGGRIHNLHHFTESFSGIRVNSWLNDNGTVIKEESPAGFVFIKEPKFKALAIDNTNKDILSSVAVRQEGAMPTDFHKLTSMRYKVGLPPQVHLDIEGGRQKLERDILTLKLETITDDVESSTCSDIENNLRPSPYIQSTDKSIVKLSSNITADFQYRTDQIRELSRWVYDNLEKRPVLGLPDALTTLESRQGDCNEHAALFAALARAAQIPTKIVAGVTYHKKAFYYHAWNEVCIGEQWVSVDTTLNQFPADLAHLRFIEGEMSEQVRIGGLIGKLSIAPIQPQKNGVHSQFDRGH